MAAESVGLLLYKRVGDEILVLLVHPGGPFWRRKDLGAWSIPKGGRIAGEDPETTARREFAEEVISTSPAWRAIPSKSNGRRAAAACRPFPKSIGRAGSRCRWRARKSIRASSPCLTRSRRLTPTTSRSRQPTRDGRLRRLPKRTCPGKTSGCNCGRPAAFLPCRFIDTRRPPPRSPVLDRQVSARSGRGCGRWAEAYGRANLATVSSSASSVNGLPRKPAERSGAGMADWE